MNDKFDLTPFAYVGNNKHYEDLTPEEIEAIRAKKEEVKSDENIEIEELPTSDEVDESCTSTLGPMLPQGGEATESEEPSVDDVMADVDEDAKLLKEALEDVENGNELYFETAGFIAKIKEKISNNRVKDAASAYSNMKMANARIKIGIAKDSNFKNSSEYISLQKQAIKAEKEFRKLKEKISPEEMPFLNGFISAYDIDHNKLIEKEINGIKEAKKAVVRQENAEDFIILNNYGEFVTESVLESVRDTFSDDMYFEGANWDIHKLYRKDLKIFREHIRNARKLLKANDFDSARKEINDAIKVIKECKEYTLKEISNIDDDNVVTAILGFIFRGVTQFCRDILLLLFLQPVAAIRELIDRIQDIINSVNSAKKRGEFRVSDINFYVNFVKNDYDRMIRVLEKFLTRIDIKEKEFNTNESVDIDNFEYDDMYIEYALDDEHVITEGGKKTAAIAAGAIGIGALGLTYAAIWGFVAYAVGKTVKDAVIGKKNLKKCISLIKDSDSDFIDPKDMQVKRFKVKKLINSIEKDKEVDKFKKVLTGLGDYIDVYSYNGKEIFSYSVIREGGYNVTINKLQFNMIEKSLKKYEMFYLAYVCDKSGVKNFEAYNWCKDFLEKYDTKESTKTESAEIITEAKDIDSGIKSVVEKLQRKGYDTLASSSGHTDLIAKDDENKNGVRDGHHYSDARLVFKGKYDLGKAPKYWYWKKVDNADEVEYLDIMQIKYDTDPDGIEAARKKWKEDYMKSLNDWVDSLPDISNKKEISDEKSVEETAMIDVNAELDMLYESVMTDLMIDVMSFNDDYITEGFMNDITNKIKEKTKISIEEAKNKFIVIHNKIYPHYKDNIEKAWQKKRVRIIVGATLGAGAIAAAMPILGLEMIVVAATTLFLYPDKDVRMFAKVVIKYAKEGIILSKDLASKKLTQEDINRIAAYNTETTREFMEKYQQIVDKVQEKLEKVKNVTDKSQSNNDKAE